jgi:acetylornithine deacetylase/succinyl-diaminopimelate desuccinylase-like protein
MRRSAPWKVILQRKPVAPRTNAPESARGGPRAHQRRSRSGPHGAPGASNARRLGLLALVPGLALLLGYGPPANAVWPFRDDAKTTKAASAADGQAPVLGVAEELLSRAIAIPTVAGAGREAELATLYVETLRAAGVEAEVVPTGSPSTALSGPATAPVAAAWGRLRGTGESPAIILLSHLDVVPADEAEWSYPPFLGGVTDTHVLGRGALDSKGISVMHLMAMLQLAEAPEKLDRDVIFLATPGEEVGGVAGAGYIARDRRELLGGASALLTEGGGIRIGQDVPPVWGIAVAEKTPCWLELTTTGTPGHTSVPMSDAAVPRLVAALDRVRRIDTPVQVLPEVEAMFRALAPTAASEDAPGYRALAETLESDRAFRKRFLSQPDRNALVRDTLAVTVLEGSSATNVAPRHARARIDARLLPGHRCEDFARQLSSIIGDDRVRVETILAFPSSPTPDGRTELFDAIETVALRKDPSALVVPRLIPGFTDAHFFRALGITAYGFTPRRLTPAESRGIHGTDEKISLANLAYGTRTLVEILRELSRR